MAKQSQNMKSFAKAARTKNGCCPMTTTVRTRTIIYLDFDCPVVEGEHLDDLAVAGPAEVALSHRHRDKGLIDDGKARMNL